jgi:ubiquinone/menaquinone biosynthesis C-methylase UbiE
MNNYKYLNYINFSFWYLPEKKVFDKNFLEFYKKILTPQRTKKEVNFIERALKLRPGMKILDLACGWGRHAIEFAKRGYKVVGQDINSLFLKEGMKEAKKIKAEIHWVKSDMREIPFENEFDVVLNLFTSFGYFTKEESHQKVFFEIARALKPKGYFFLDVVNREKILHPYQPKRIIKARNGSTLIIEKNFDLINSRSNERRILIFKNRKRREFYLSIRIFTLTELISMARKAKLIFKKVYGDYRGNPFNFHSERCILITQKV